MPSTGEPLALNLKVDFDYIRHVVRQQSSIVLESTKEYLAEARLLPLARREGMTSLGELVSRLRTEAPTGVLHRQVVEAMTTNETSFFRDIHPFDALKDVILPELLETRKAFRTLRIWSAACSTGQEAYSISMLLKERFPELASWTVEIWATDLATHVLDKAREARFGQHEVNRGLPIKMLMKYFEKDGTEWIAKEDLRTMVTFTQLNLAERWPARPPFDIVFLRNVLIYFDQDTKKSILDQVQSILRPDGYLFLGAAETTLNLNDSFERVKLDHASCYRLKQETS